jgi:hypothetical protein
MSSQEDRLLDNPIFADSEDPSFNHIREVDFPDLLKQAIRLEIASKNNDWEIPTEKVVTKRVESERLNSSPNLDKIKPRSKEHGIGEDGTSQTILKSSDELTEKVPSVGPPLPSNTHPVRFMGNTPFPSEGVMLDGSVPLEVEPNRVNQPEDPWALKPKDRKVKTGVTITLGGSKKS